MLVIVSLVIGLSREKSVKNYSVIMAVCPARLPFWQLGIFLLLGFGILFAQ
jgi:hypothetical protein